MPANEKNHQKNIGPRFKKILKFPDGHFSLTGSTDSTGRTTEFYVSAADPSIESEYYFSEDLEIETKNNKHKLRMTFESLEIQENKELLHFLYKNVAL